MKTDYLEILMTEAEHCTSWNHHLELQATLRLKKIILKIRTVEIEPGTEVLRTNSVIVSCFLNDR